MFDAILAADAALRTWLSSYHNDVLDFIMLGLSAIGRGGMIWLILGVVLALRQRVSARAVWQLALAIGLTALLVDQVIKPAFGRRRPFDRPNAVVRVIDHRPSTASFPSGHAANAAAGAFALSRVWPQGSPLLWTLAAAIGLSRVYVGAHYPLDVVAGAVVGVLCAGFVIGGTRWRVSRGA